MAGGGTKDVGAARWEGGTFTEAPDAVVVEEPLEIRLRDQPVAVTMRTPGEDADLAVGFLFTEGILSRPEQVAAVHFCEDAENPNRGNIVEVHPSPGFEPPGSGWQRAFYTTSSCGICGRASIEAVKRAAPPLADRTAFDPVVFYGLPDHLRSSQRLFGRTGSLHAAGLFDAGGRLEIVREDVGRHNAVDKVIGSCFLAEKVPLRGRILLVSGRASFEIVQKAFIAGIPAVAALSGVSSLALELAEESGMLLVGFLRGRAMKAYAGSARLRGA